MIQQEQDKLFGDNCLTSEGRSNLDHMQKPNSQWIYVKNRNSH